MFEAICNRVSISCYSCSCATLHCTDVSVTVAGWTATRTVLISRRTSSDTCIACNCPAFRCEGDLCHHILAVFKYILKNSPSNKESTVINLFLRWLRATAWWMNRCDFSGVPTDPSLSSGVRIHDYVCILHFCHASMAVAACCADAIASRCTVWFRAMEVAGVPVAATQAALRSRAGRLQQRKRTFGIDGSI